MVEKTSSKDDLQSQKMAEAIAPERIGSTIRYLIPMGNVQMVEMLTENCDFVMEGPQLLQVRISKSLNISTHSFNTLVRNLIQEARYRRMAHQEGC